jgi:serine/threonine-protein kinase HipA
VDRVLLQTTSGASCFAYDPNFKDCDHPHPFRHNQHSRIASRRPMAASAMLLCRSITREECTDLDSQDACASTGLRRKQTWTRLVFNILISNTDDHLRNHGFLYARQQGWRLSPAYDLNPVPTDMKPRILATAVNEDDNTASLSLELEVAGYFDLDAGQAREVAAQIGQVVAKWRDEAERHGLAKSEIDRMASAFEHEDLQLARSS